MPFINVQVNNTVLKKMKKHQIQQGITELMRDVMHKKYDVTAVRIASDEMDGWTIGGELSTLQNAAVVQVDIHVTKDTNNDDEKQKMIAATWDLLTKCLGELHPVGYIIIHDHPATAWGYGGRTQAERARA